LILDSLSKIKNLIRSRAYAYRMVFSPENKYTSDVLKDLAKFCRAHESTFHSDARKHAALEGRREVFLRVMEHLNLTEEQIFELHKVKDMTEAKK
jgi:hypothetical protein